MLSSTIALAATTASVSAMHITQAPRAEATATTSPDPWQCVTENVTQYFDVPKPTGSLLDALLSYGDELIAPCVSTATGLDKLSCSVSETSAWCGFTTAAPSAVSSDYASYGSAAASFWSANSRTASAVASECPVAWSKPGLTEQAWLNQTIAHASCYIAAHSANATTGSSTTLSTSTAGIGASVSAPTATTTNGVLGRAQGGEGWVLASAGFTAAVNAIW